MANRRELAFLALFLAGGTASAASDSGRIDGWLGAENRWVRDKAVPALTLRAGKGLVWVDLEAAGIWLTRPSPDLDVSFLGNELGAALMLSPVHTRRLELRFGAGGDFFYLWNIHANEWQMALSARAALHGAVTDRFGVFASARAYPLATRGLGLGETRSGSQGLPVLFSTGIEWRLR